MRALIAPDAFKGTLSAIEASGVIAGSFEAAGIECDRCPIADGGDGTLDVLLAHGFTAHEVDVVDAANRPRTARIGIRDSRAVIELAEVCGLVTVADLPLDGWHRTTLGLGQAASAAIAAGCTEITLTVGGSASIDGGIGLLIALGFAVLDADGAPVTPDLAGMLRADRIEPRALPGVTWQVLVDVTTPIAGRESTAMVFGAQKGLAAVDRVHGDEALRHWAALLERTFGVDVRELEGGGAAGGVAAGAHAALGAELISGAAQILAITGFEELLRAADLVVTGEGSFDEQSLLGKGTGAVIASAHAANRPVHVLAGVSAMSPTAANVTSIHTCVQFAGSAESARAEPARWLGVAAAALARRLSATGGAHD